VSHKQDRREPRIDFSQNKEIIVYYKMISKCDSNFRCDDIFRGELLNLSRSGLLLDASIPAESWLPGLEDGDIQLGFNLQTPDTKIKLLGRIRWAQLRRWPIFYRFGVEFEPPDSTNNDKLKCLLIRTELEQRKTPETRRIKRIEELLINPTFTKG